MIVWQQLFFAFHLSSFFSGITYQGLSPQQLCKKTFHTVLKRQKVIWWQSTASFLEHKTGWKVNYSEEAKMFLLLL